MLRFGPTYLAIGILGLWMPAVTSRPPIDIPNLDNFIGNLWQVEAAALGLTVAVSIFAFQALASSRWRTDLRDFAKATLLLPVVFLGSSSLLVNGFVLLGWGRGASAGWAATWALLLAAFTLLCVPLLLVLVLRAIDPSTLRRRLLGRLAAEVSSTVERDVTLRLSLSLLRTRCEALGAKYSWLSHPQPWHGAIASSSAGLVTDIRLRRLEQVVNLAAKRKANEAVQVTVHLGQVVSADSVLVLLPEGSTEAERTLARKIVKTSGQQEERDGLGDALDLLHAAAIDAIRGGEAGWYGEIRDAYLETFMAFPNAWARYGQEFDHGLASGSFPFRLGEMNRLGHDVLSQLREAMAAGQRDIASSVAYLPIAAAARAIPVGAHGLSSQMLDLVVTMSWIVQEFPDDPVAKMVSGQLGLTMCEYVDYHASSRLQREDLPLPAREDAARFLIEAGGSLAEYIKALIDRRALGEIPSLVSRWEDALRHWEPDPQYFQFEVDLAKGASPVDADAVSSAERSRDLAANMQTLANEIESTRRRQLFELTAWTVGLLQEDEGETRLLETLQGLAPRTGTDRERAAAASEAIEAERLSKWITLSLPSRHAHFIGTNALVIDAFVIATVMGMSPDSTPSFDPTEWISQREQSLVAAADALRKWTFWPDLLPDGRIDERIDQFCTGVRETAAQQHRLERIAIIRTRPDEELVSQFGNWLEEGYQGARLAPIVLGREIQTEPRAVASSPVFLGVDEWVPKEWFLPSNKIGNIDGLARGWGSDIARVEGDAILRELQRAGGRRLVGTNLADRVEAAAQRLRDEGYVPNVVLSPINWQLRRELSAQLLPEDDPRLGPAGSRAGNRGKAEVSGLLLVDSPHWPGDRLVVADGAAYLRFTQTVVEPENEPFVAALTFFTSAEALEYAAEHPKALWTKDLRSRAGRAEEISTKAYLRARVAVQVGVEDNRAAITVRIPTGLQSDR